MASYQVIYILPYHLFFIEPCFIITLKEIFSTSRAALSANKYLQIEVKSAVRKGGKRRRSRQKDREEITCSVKPDSSFTYHTGMPFIRPSAFCFTCSVLCDARKVH